MLRWVGRLSKKAQNEIEQARRELAGFVFYGGRSSAVERRIVAPVVAGSNPVAHPKFKAREQRQVDAEVNISNRGDGDSPSVQRRGADRSEHIESLSPQGDFGGIAQKEERDGPNVEAESSSLSTPSRTLAATVGTPLDHECPACKAPKGVSCRSASTHYDRVILIRV